MQDLLINSVDIIPFIDLTSLNQNDNEESITALCKNAITPFGNVAAVCVYHQFVKLSVNLLKHTSINIATVVNFPHGESELPKILQEIESALNHQANEIDMVFPYRDYLNGNKKKALKTVAAARALCRNDIKLKIIIETGKLKSLDTVKLISEELINLGVDFIKTSTGKTEHGASLEAATAILSTIKEALPKHSESGSANNINELKNNLDPMLLHHAGIKISGGIRTISQAQSYIQLTNEIMGKEWINPSVFRIGASGLLSEILVENF